VSTPIPRKFDARGRDLEKKRAESRLYYSKHKAEKRAYYLANKERIDAVAAARRGRRKEHVAAIQRAYFLANKKRCYEMTRAWKLAHPEKKVAMVWRARLKWRYGLTAEQFEAKVFEQGGCCATCPTKDGESVGKTKRLAVDHDHSIGSRGNAVRGLLCHRCNWVLGILKDDASVLRRLADYVDSWNAKR
jgi:hypothetical protein